MADELPKRRFKLESELSSEERAAASRLGSSGKVERDEYVKARRALLRAGEDDPELRARLLREEAESLRDRARAATGEGLEAMTPKDWVERDQTKSRGEEPAKVAGTARGDELVSTAADMEREAAELAAHMTVETSVDDHLEQIRRHR